MYLRTLPWHDPLCLLFSINVSQYDVCAPSRIMTACHGLAALKNPHRLETFPKTQNIIHIPKTHLLLTTHSGQQQCLEGYNHLVPVHLATAVMALNSSFNVNIGFVRDQCYERTLRLIADGLLAADDEAFYRDSTTGRPMNNADSLTLTLSGCERLCGASRAWYTDVGPRLAVWLIPSFLLIGNLELSPLGKQRFFAILHLLGDSIDSLGSLIDKLASWDHCFRVAARRGYCSRCTRTIATIYAGFEELEGARVSRERPHINDPERQAAPQNDIYYDLDTLAERYDLTGRFQAWRVTAVELANSRTNGFLRTGLAIVLYVFQIIGGFVAVVGGAPSSPPGGRIATSVLLSWLLPTVLLSNVVGTFSSRYTARDILTRFDETAGIQPAGRLHSSNPPDGALAWSGGIYTFRPWKYSDRKAQNKSMSSRHKREMILIQLLSILPAFIGIVGACLILWNLIPNGFNCRHTWTIAVFFAWLASAFITRVSYTPAFATGKHHWYFVLAKDALIAVPTVAVMFLSGSGLFNTCKCWSGYLYYRTPRVSLNTHPFFTKNDSTLYQYIVWSCLALQGLVFLIIMVRWRKGLEVLRWSEKAKQQERKRVQDDYVCPCMAVEELADLPADEV